MIPTTNLMVGIIDNKYIILKNDKRIMALIYNKYLAYNI